MISEDFDYKNKIWNRMNPIHALCETTIRPFLEPFIDIWMNFASKIVFIILSGVVMIVSFLADLFQSPEIWWGGLMILVFLDFLAGSIRAIFHPKIKFHWRYWTRTVYKFASYACVILALAAAANMFPDIFEYVQYTVICILVGSEVHSIIRKLPVPVLKTLEKALRKKGIDPLGGSITGKDNTNSKDK